MVDHILTMIQVVNEQLSVYAANSISYMLKDHDCGSVVYNIGFQTPSVQLYNSLSHQATRLYILFNINFYFVFIL